MEVAPVRVSSEWEDPEGELGLCVPEQQECSKEPQNRRWG